MKCVETIIGIDKKTSIRQLFNKFNTDGEAIEGFCYYKYPLAGGIENYLPDLTIISKELGFLVFESIEYTINDIEEINAEYSIIKGVKKDNPLLQLEDYEFALSKQYEKYRNLRNKIKINPKLLLANIKESEFNTKFPDFYNEFKDKLVFDNYLEITIEDFWLIKTPFTEVEWKSIVSITQGADILTSHKSTFDIKPSNVKGEAIESIKQELALLDNEQFDAAVQIPNCAQRIRGLAGTGKTIVLCMKAAYYHQRFPEHKILYTFNTQSLYNQVTSLITKFYEAKEGKKPNWDNLHILHSWGGRTKPGIYYNTCIKNEIHPLNYNDCGNFGMVCNSIINETLKEDYDLILMDEAQDFPLSFYKLMYKILKDPKRIVWAYDELQNIEGKEIPDTGDLFGYDEKGNKIVDLEELYKKYNMETDMILKKSYRNPLKVLMTAHSIGLGLYNQENNEANIIQMIDKKEIWNSIGYEISKGTLTIDEETIIKRPPENSPNPVSKYYNGQSEAIKCEFFDCISDEIQWIANSIEIDINEEKIKPEEILVITLNGRKMKNVFSELQTELYERGIYTIIPGINETRDVFKKSDFVTLSTVPKAKGNEAFKVYVINFDYLYKDVDSVAIRNKAFTSITRTKGWCVLTGVGEDMTRAIEEVDKTITNIPEFKFIFPDMNKIKRSLSNEEYRKKVQQIKKYNTGLDDILNADEELVKHISKDKVKELAQKLGLIE